MITTTKSAIFNASQKIGILIHNVKTFLNKCIAFILFFYCINSHLLAQSLGLNNPTPDASSILDATATDRGVLIPRMTTANRNAIASPADGLLVYDTDLDAFYYYDATAVAAWRPLLAGSKSTSSLAGWSTLGNSGTVAATNFLGTTDAIDFRIRTNNLERMTILSGGDVGIGTTAPQRFLHISSTANNLLMLQSTVGGGGNTANMDFMTYDVGGTVYPTSRISAIDNNWSSDLAFYTKVPGANTNGLAERVRITNGGNLGVGTTTPESNLQVYGGAANTWLTIGASDAAAYNAGIYMKENATTAGNSRGFKLYYNSWDFYIDRNDGGADVNVLFIERTNGDIGIGTTAPAVKLDVTGTIRGTVIQATTNGAGAYQYNTTTNMTVPDYVFDKYYTGNAPENPVYEMMSLNKLETYIHKNRHLPRVPSRSEINKDGIINTQAISMLTLEKAEENTLYIIELNKKIEEQQKIIEALRNEINANKKEMELMIKTLQFQLNVPIEK